MSLIIYLLFEQGFVSFDGCVPTSVFPSLILLYSEVLGSFVSPPPSTLAQAVSWTLYLGNS